MRRNSVVTGKESISIQETCDHSARDKPPLVASELKAPQASRAKVSSAAGNKQMRKKKNESHKHTPLARTSRSPRNLT